MDPRIKAACGAPIVIAATLCDIPPSDEHVPERPDGIECAAEIAGRTNMPGVYPRIVKGGGALSLPGVLVTRV